MSEESEGVKILREILKWIRFSGIKEVKTVLDTALDSERKKIAYQASDGKKTTREVAAVAGFGSKTTVADLWILWKRLGLGETSLTQGGGDRFKRSFDLEDFGIQVEIKRVPAETGKGTAGSQGSSDSHNREC